jgi:hypothetical protein
MAAPQVRQANYTDYSNSYNEMLFVIRQKMAELQTALPVKVVAVKPNNEHTGFVDVQPLVQQISADSTVVDHGIIYNVPYFRIQGGINGIIIDPVVGDIGLCDFCSRDISAVKNAKQIAPPASRRMHSFSDAVYIGGFLNKAPTRFIEFNDNGINVVPIEKFTYNSIEVATINDVKAAADAAKAANSQLNERLNKESLSTQNADSVLTDNLKLEQKRAQEEEAYLQAQIDAEIARAEAAEAAETAARIAADAVLAAAIVAETTRAQTAETQLHLDIVAETTRATSAETQLNININDEKTRAENAEASLSAAISTLSGEVSAGGAALSDEIAAVSSALSTETTNRTTADTDLQTQITALSNKMIGVGQTWQDVSSSRETNTDYTNSTGKPIFVEVSDKNVVNNGLEMTCDGITVGYFSFDAGNTNASIGAIIPNNSVYKVYKLNSSGDRMTTVQAMQWSELR